MSEELALRALLDELIVDHGWRAVFLALAELAEIHTNLLELELGDDELGNVTATPAEVAHELAFLERMDRND